MKRTSNKKRTPIQIAFIQHTNNLVKNKNWKKTIGEQLHQIYTRFEYTCNQIDTIIALAELNLLDFPNRIDKQILEEIKKKKKERIEYEKRKAEERKNELIVEWYIPSSTKSKEDFERLMQVFDIEDNAESFGSGVMVRLHYLKSGPIENFPINHIEYLVEALEENEKRSTSDEYSFYNFERIIYSQKLIMILANLEAFVTEITSLLIKLNLNRFSNRLSKFINDKQLINKENQSEIINRLIHLFLQKDKPSLKDQLINFEKITKSIIGLENDEWLFLEEIREIRNSVIHRGGVFDQCIKSKVRAKDLKIGELIPINFELIAELDNFVWRLSTYLTLRIWKKYFQN